MIEEYAIELANLNLERMIAIEKEDYEEVERLERAIFRVAIEISKIGQIISRWKVK